MDRLPLAGRWLSRAVSSVAPDLVTAGHRALETVKGQVAWLWCDESGAATVEYALLVSIIVVGTAGSWASLRTALVAYFERTVAAVAGGS